MSRRALRNGEPSTIRIKARRRPPKTRFPALAGAAGASLTILWLSPNPAQAQQAGSPIQLPPVVVSTTGNSEAYAAQPEYKIDSLDLGPFGDQTLLDLPQSVTVVPEDLIVNQQSHTVNDTLRYLPSVEIRDQQGFEVSRPQSRGFQGSIVQATRLDGLNIIGTTAIAAENLAGVQVLNGLAGSLYGPETPAGVFNYILKRPTDTPLYRFIEGYDSNSIFTEQVDVGGRTGPDGKIGYRFNFVHGEGQDYAPGSELNRTLASGAVDFHIDDQTVIETNFIHYETNSLGLPGSIVYDGASSHTGTSSVLPKAIDPTRLGYGQPDAGPDLISNTGLVKIKHTFNEDWNIELGGLYEDAIRNLWGVTNTLNNNNGNFTTTKNFTAIPNYTIGSNSAYLNGHIDLFGTKNDVTIGTNGFTNGQYSYRDSIATVLGSATLADPVVFPAQPTPYNGGQYKSGELEEQSIITGDTIHLDPALAFQGVVSTSFLSSESFSKTGLVTSSDMRQGAVSPTVSVIYKPTPKLSTYATFATSIEQGDQAPAGTVNANQFMSFYRDREYEAGIKYAVSDDLLVTLDGFRMTRPLAETNATTNIFQVVGTQRNYGVELFAQGNVTKDLSIFGGVTYIDARLIGTGNPLTDDKLVVGVPHFKTDILLDYHPDFFHGVALTGAVHSESARAATNTGNSYAPSYATMDLGIRYAVPPYLGHHVTARFQVINVTNTFYYSSIADGNIAGSPGANTAYVGAPRTFEASLELDF